jgi:prevent-host-death family protein
MQKVNLLLVSRTYIGIKEARPVLGDLVTAAQQGADIVLTRNGKPAARIVRYQEEPAMNITLDLINADVDAARITSNPLGEIRINIDGGHIIAGSEPMDDDPDTEWWTATRYDDEGTEAMIYEGTDTAALVRVIAAA